MANEGDNIRKEDIYHENNAFQIKYPFSALIGAKHAICFATHNLQQNIKVCCHRVAPWQTFSGRVKEVLAFLMLLVR